MASAGGARASGPDRCDQRLDADDVHDAGQIVAQHRERHFGGGANVVFEIPDMPEAVLRTMVAPMCLVQALALGLTIASN